jgi:hypothetical protein
MATQGQGAGQQVQLMGSTQQQQQEEQVASGVPLDLLPEAERFLVKFQPTWKLVDEDFNALQLPAGYLQAALAPALEQQHRMLLPEPGCCCCVDLQLVDVSVEQHPLGQQHGCVACVKMFSNILPGMATLQTQQDGSCRYGVRFQHPK